MGVPEPPYLYDAPTQRPISFPYSSYEPKSVTRESWNKHVEASRPRTTRPGPLIDFNRHPDSYMVVSGTEHKFTPMPSSTKKWVSAMRWIQFSLRILQLFGAGGILFCAITLKVPDQMAAWMLRITPGVDLLVTLYAVYHLIRSSTARTPGSSASYHVFALIMDCGLIPFYAFIAVFANGNINSGATADQWPSVFTNANITTYIVLGSFYAACALAALHFIALCLDIYLIIVFRKIANLPPDMNPLEDNLTSRKSSKHKYKNSEISLADTIAEKHAAYYSGSTLNDKTVNIDAKEPEVRQIPFGHSRAGSDLSFSPHNPRSARHSKQQYDHAIYQQASARASTVSVGKPQSFMTANSRAASPVKEDRLRAKKELVSDNWYVLDDENVDIGTTPMKDLREPKLPNIKVPKESDFVHKPLEMNPPTPLSQTQHQRNALGEVSINRSLTVTSDNTVTSSVYSESAPSLVSSKVRTPKSKYYGDLTAAARGIRGYAQLPQGDSPTRQKESPGRVVSRSGADIADEKMTFIPEKNSRRRMVSGKAAEEGLAGRLWY